MRETEQHTMREGLTFPRNEELRVERERSGISEKGRGTCLNFYILVLRVRSNLSSGRGSHSYRGREKELGWQKGIVRDGKSVSSGSR